jgi:hypothetical protein
LISKKPRSKISWYSFQEPVMAKLAKLSSKNQITLPKEVMAHYPGTEYFEVRESEAGITLAPVKARAAQSFDALIAELRRDVARLGLTPKDVADAVKWARKSIREKKA